MKILSGLPVAKNAKTTIDALALLLVDVLKYEVSCDSISQKQA